MKVVVSAVSLIVLGLFIGIEALPASSSPEEIIELEGELFLMQSCSSKADCPRPQELYECINGRCMGVVLQKVCTQDADCPQYYVCVSGRCIGK